MTEQLVEERVVPTTREPARLLGALGFREPLSRRMLVAHEPAHLLEVAGDNVEPEEAAEDERRLPSPAALPAPTSRRARRWYDWSYVRALYRVRGNAEGEKARGRMIVVRHTFQAKYGRGDELVAILKEMAGHPEMRRYGGRILTDTSGQFFTVVQELEVESLAAWEGMFGENMRRPEFGQWFAKTVPLIESGRRDFYTVVE